MSNLTDFFPSGGGGGLTPKFEEFNASGTFTPSQALIDAGGYIEVFLVGGGASSGSNSYGGSGGETIFSKMYLTSTNSISVVIGAGAVAQVGTGGSSSFGGSSAGGADVNCLGGANGYGQLDRMGSGWSSTIFSSGGVAAGAGVLGYGAGGSASGYNDTGGVRRAKPNSGQGSDRYYEAGSGYCLIKWYE